MSGRIEHDAANQLFAADMGGGKATLQYVREGDVIDLTSVFVPAAYRGKGMGARLTKAAFEYAKTERLRVIPTCPFIRHDFLGRFPEYRELLAPGA